MSGTVLVTGAGGFVGSAVVRALVGAAGAGEARFDDGAPVERVVALLRPGGSMERLRELPRSADWEVAHADLAEPAALRAMLERLRPRAIAHVALDKAAHAGLSEAEMARTVERPLEVLFEGLAGTPVARLVHTGSAWVLRAGDRLAEDAPIEARLPYATAKLRQDRLLPLLGQRTGVAWINLRLFNMFGRHEDRSRLLPTLVARLSRGQVAELSHGTQVRDFNDVDDMARAYLLALAAGPAACGAVYHIGSGRGLSTGAFAATVAEVTGGAERIRFGSRSSPDQDLACLVCDPALARRVLGWSPPDDSAGRIRRAAAWWLERIRGESAAAAGRPAAVPDRTIEGSRR